jgi:alanine racemase
MIYLNDILQATAGRLLGPPSATEFSDFCFDSRRVEDGQLFVAVRTDKGDGHDYILDAIRGGATGVLSQEPRGLDGYHVTCVLVADTETALRQWAAALLANRDIEVIAVTGSVGKTSTKEAVASVLAARAPVFRNRGSFNGTFGLPIALGRLQAAHRLAVLELGSDRLGEIGELAALTRPRVGIVTAVTAAHLEMLGSLDCVAAEKGSLLERLPAHGLAVLNWDDLRVRAMAKRTPARVITVGLEEGAELRALDVQVSLDGTRFSVQEVTRRHSVRVPWLGRPRVFAALAAIAVGREYGIPWPEMVASLAELGCLPGRLNALPAVDGAVLLDDTNNSSPAAAVAALDLLRQIVTPGRKIAVLGDMHQLGESTVVEHQKVGAHAAQIADHLVVKGELAAEIGRGAESAGMATDKVYYAYSADEVIRYLLGDQASRRPQLEGGPLTNGDVVLVKGSALTRLERVSRALLADPDRDGDQLVRQHPVFGQVVMSLPGRPTWLEIDVEAAANNVRLTRQLVGPSVLLMVVLKADAYGHGATRLARVALNNGADRLAVASLNEAIALRDAGIKSPILVLGFSPAWTARQALLNDVAVALYDRDIARAFNRAAHELGRKAVAHVKVDTGMGRLGLLPPEVPSFLETLSSLEGIQVEGIFTHFSVADSTSQSHRDHTDEQFRRFHALLDRLEAGGLRPPLAHCANSAAIFARPDTHLDMVRLGIALHGLDPSPAVRCPVGFKRSLSFKAMVAQVKTLPPGTPISYGNTYLTESEQHIAVIPVGYADGFRRGPSHWGEVLVRGRRAPIIGRVTMDQTIIDVTAIPGVRIGDEVVLIGRQGADEITAEQVADRLGTINYEVVSAILARVPRVT